MGDKTGIEWTDATWNPIVGCSIVSPGCANCYAMGQAERIQSMYLATHMKAGGGAPFLPSPYAGTTRETKTGPVWTGRVAVVDDHALTKPLRWRRPRRIFVNSMGDLFHESVPDAWIDRVFAVMALAPWHTFQVLTKRSKRMREYLTADAMRFRVRVEYRSIDASGAALAHQITHLPVFPLPNVWLGVSTEDQRRADERVPDLLATPAAVRFASAEPVLGSIGFRCVPWVSDRGFADALTGMTQHPETREKYPDRFPDTGKLDWIIVGGESGRDARPMHPAWEAHIREQCASAGVAYFRKQWGEWKPVSAMTEDEIDACYAPSSAPDAIRRVLAPQCIMHADGTVFRDRTATGAYAASSGAMLMFRAGKKRAGDGILGLSHRAFPEAGGGARLIRDRLTET